MNKYISHLLTLFFAGNISCVIAAQNATPIYQLSDVKGTFVQVPLTHDIYRYAHYPDLRDLKVIDADLNSLPYQLVSVKPQMSKPEAKVITEDLAFFPVAVDATPDTLRKLHTSQTRIKGDQVQIATSDKLLDNKTPEFYLIDVNEIDHAITDLIIEWSELPANQYLEVELEATHNLQDWISLGHATLVQITRQDQQLKHNQIKVDIAKKEYEFLRLKIIRGAEQLSITRIEAQQKTLLVGDIKNTSEHWNLEGKQASLLTSVYFANSHSKMQAVAAWEFVRDELTPIESFSINLGTSVYGDGVKVFSRNTEKQEWQLLHQGVWFNVQVGEVWQTSEPVSIYPNHDKFWRVELNESAKNSSTPKLIFSWQPLQLQVITNSKPPFSVAISNEANADTNNRQVFNQIVSAASPTWVSANLVKLDVQPQALSAREKSVDWRQLIFWAVLLAAVAVLLIFSLKLFKQLKVSQLQE